MICNYLVLKNKIIFPPLHINLGLTEQFSKALDKEGKCFEYLCNNFPGISKEKKKMEIFDAPDIGKFLKDPHFIESINNVESRA